MKCTMPEISWHNRDPVLTIDMQPCKLNDDLYRLATGGTDSHVLIWLLSVEKGGVASLECAADLTRHSKPVNCVRFSPSGDLLASGDDESCIIVWKMKTSSDPVEFPSGDDESFKEQWTSVKVLRGHLQDVYDLCWSADSRNLISGSVDNTAILWDISTGKNIGILGDHKGFVQGVTWDPCGQYVATMSSDRICRVYNTTSQRVVAKIFKGRLPGAKAESKPTHFFHDDTLKSFFRRLTFTPDGELLIVPSGLVEEPDKNPSNATMVFSRHCLNKPIMYLPSLNQYTVAVRCCPVLFTLRPMKSPPLFDLPFRTVIAVATQCSIVLYDTQHAAPFAFITKIHYTRLTDLSWSSDGRVLVASSTDGYCSVITFAENELGTIYTGQNKDGENNQKEESTQRDMPTEEQCGGENAENKLIDIQVERTPEKERSNSEVKCVNKIPKNDYLCQSENANMSFETSSQDDQEQTVAKEVTTETFALSSQLSKTADLNPPSLLLEPKLTPMEVDDFQLVYEGTVTEPVMEPNTLLNTDQNTVTKACENMTELSIVKSPGQLIDSKASAQVPQDKPLDSSTNKAPEESPNKRSDITSSLQQDALTSPRSSGVNITPGNKKTPRRVQLITLSSPKSKKKLLQ